MGTTQVQGRRAPGSGDLARATRALAASLPAVRIVGGCCGTDARHVAAIWEGWSPVTG